MRLTRNSAKRFDQASASKKRIMIAKDVITQIKGGKIKVKSSNSYFEAPWLYFIRNRGKQLKALLGVEKPCTVCALGACFHAHVAIKNKFETGHIDRVSIEKTLKGIFSRNQMALIECAFEMSAHQGYSSDSALSKRYKARDYRYGIDLEDRDQDSESLVAIMQNIIDNKGTFTI